MDAQVPKALQAVVLRCLHKERTGRFSSIAGLAAALASFARDQRGAGTIVDRTKLIQQRKAGAPELSAAAAQSSSTTTVRQSGGARPARTPGRILGDGRLVAIIAAVVAVVV